MNNFNRNRAATLAQNSRPKRLPYAPLTHHLNPADQNSIAVCTGSQAWTRGKSPSGWFSGRRLVLPFGADPEGLRWPVAGRDCIVFGFGEAEPRERLVALSAALVRAGAAAVRWQGQWALTVYSDGTSRAHLIEDADLSRRPVPVFLPSHGRAAA